MKVSEYEIKNFRGIKIAKIRMGQTIAFVGENNAGKSSFLRALNAFFNFEDEKPHFESGSHNFTSRSIPKVKVTFSSDEPPTDLRQYFKNNKCILELEYKKGKGNFYHIQGKARKEIGIDLFQKFKKVVSFVLIPQVRDHSKINGDSKTLFIKILNQYLAEQTKNRDELTPKFRKGFDHIQNKVFAKIAKELKHHYLLDSKFKFEINFPEELDYTHVIHGISLTINDNDNKFFPEDCGSGIQSLTLIALYRLLSSLTNTNIILGIEEPEMNLHPQAQRELMSALTKSTTETDTMQILLTTHSPAIVDQLDHLDIVICKRSLDTARGFKITAGQLPSNFWQKHGLDELKTKAFFKYKNSDFFFARHVIICEGRSDVEVIKILASKNEINLESLGVSILNLDGVGSTKYPVSILKELDFPHTVIVDKDFFFQYRNDDLERSRDSSGYPQYKSEFDPAHLSTIDFIFKKPTVKENLRKNLLNRHTKALDILEKYNWVCFNYTIEIDLIKSAFVREEYFKILSTPPEKRSEEELLVNNHKAIKRYDNIVTVVNSLPTANYPHSYSRLKKLLIKLRDSIFKNEEQIFEAESEVMGQQAQDFF